MKAFKNLFFYSVIFLLFYTDASANNNCRLSTVKPDSCQELACYVRQKALIPLSVIKNKTLIDSTYLHKDVFFTGDTIYALNENYSALILDYNDGLVCSYKFILIMDLKNNVNTDDVIGKTDCDRDGENEYYSYSFVIKNGIIKITQKHAEEGEDELKILRTSSYTVTKNGKLKTK